MFWQRLGLLIMFDPYSLLSSNEYRWVAEERVAFNSPRPSALNLVNRASHIVIHAFTPQQPGGNLVTWAGRGRETT